jgi:NAD(P)H-dependent FMN reductase
VENGNKLRLAVIIGSTGKGRKKCNRWHNEEWHGRPVGFVSYGGNSGGLRAVEQLRQVFAELHVVMVRNTVGFHHVWNHFNSTGQPSNMEKSEAAARSMLAQLAWCGQVLREAKLTRPYKF